MSVIYCPISGSLIIHDSLNSNAIFIIRKGVMSRIIRQRRAAEISASLPAVPSTSSNPSPASLPLFTADGTTIWYDFQV
jgi:hypothetical protein